MRETNRDHRTNETTRFEGEIRARKGTRPHGESTYQCGRRRKQGRNSSFRCVGSVCRRLKRGKMRMETPLLEIFRIERLTSKATSKSGCPPRCSRDVSFL